MANLDLYLKNLTGKDEKNAQQAAFYLIDNVDLDSLSQRISGKINFYVENTRVGQMVDYDKLTIEVWTDGSLKPFEALSIASLCLSEITLYSLFRAATIYSATSIPFRPK